MLRECELAGAKLVHAQFDVKAGLEGDRPTAAHLLLPVHKTSQGGGEEVTRRTLRCACQAALHPLCPVHALARHTQRLRARGPDFNSLHTPLVPDASGQMLTKAAFVSGLQQLLLAAGETVMFLDHTGASRPRFQGHALRVTGAQYLTQKGVDPAAIMLLGRWSSSSFERYRQQAPLLLAEQAPTAALQAGHKKRDSSPESAFAEPMRPQIQDLVKAPEGRGMPHVEIHAGPELALASPAERALVDLETICVQHSRTG